MGDGPSLTDAGQLNGHSKASEYYFQACLSQLQEQYTAAVQVQTRAHQVFAVATTVVGVVAAALLSAQITLSPLSKLIGIVILVQFSVTVLICIRVMRPLPWRSGPQMNAVREKYSELKKNDDVAGLWFGRQMNNSYKYNQEVQSLNAKLFGRSLMCLFLMIVSIVVFGITVTA